MRAETSGMSEITIDRCRKTEGRNRSSIGQKGSRAEDTTAAIERFATSSVRKVGRTSDGTMKLSRKINRCPKSLSAIGHQCPYISAVKSGPFPRSRYIKKLNDIETDISVGEDGSYSLGRRGANFSSGEVACTFRGKCSYFLTALVILSFRTKLNWIKKWTSILCQLENFGCLWYHKMHFYHNFKTLIIKKYMHNISRILNFIHEYF